MQLISYLFGIESDRQLCRDIHLNLAYRWFYRLPLYQSVPHHSSLTRIRDRMGTSRYQQIFKLMLLQWQKQGRFTGKQIVADATLVKANASMDSLVEREDADPNARVLKQYEKRYHDFQHGKRKRRVANQTHVSASDLDATMVYRKGTEGGLKYKVHYSADVKTRIITDCYTTTGSTHEGPILPARIDYLCDEMGFDVQEVIADRGYGRGPTYSAFFRQRKIRTYIPLHDAHLGKGKLTPTEFKYHSKADRYQCPEGYFLYPYEKLDNALIKRYRITGGYCRQCSKRVDCLPDSAKSRARFAYRSPHQYEIDKVRARQETRAFICKMILRKWTIEGLFAEAKQFHKLKRARYRGLQKVSIQALMTAIAQNIKRIIKQLLDIFLLLRKYLYPRKEILGVQNYLDYFRRTPKLFLYKSALA
jgi:IS5 family transposase